MSLCKEGFFDESQNLKERIEREPLMVGTNPLQRLSKPREVETNPRGVRVGKDILVNHYQIPMN
jgi:hypothetical protein